jgi:hypothetical protein
MTIILVIQGIFTSKIDSLPPSSDVKMLDIWLIGCFIYPFLHLILRTIMENMKTLKEEREKNRVRQDDVSDRCVSPLVIQVELIEGEGGGPVVAGAAAATGCWTTLRILKKAGD